MATYTKKSVVKILRQQPTEDAAKQFLERVLYRYLNKIIDKVVQEYDISEQDANTLRDKLVNMNLIECCVETDAGEDDGDNNSDDEADS
jgi:hypothetical protein